MQTLITKLFIALSDLFWLILLFYLATFIRQNLHGFSLPEFHFLELYDFLFIIFIIFILLYFEKIYAFRYDFWQDTRKVMQAFAIGFGLTLSLLALSHTTLEYSRLFLLLYFTLGFFLLPIAKRYTKKMLFSFSFFKKRVLVVGDEEKVARFKMEMQNNFYLGQKFSKDTYQSVIIISQGMELPQLNTLIEKYLHKHSELFVVPYITNINFAQSNILEYSNIRLNTIQIENKLLIKRNIIIKNIFDKAFSLMLVPFFVLLHLCISFLIKRDSEGKVLFKQQRLGQYGEHFDVYKYRTMYENADAILQKYLEENPNEIEYYEIFHKYKNDPRITKIGKLLRATSLDELPQLLNVVRGEMSLVGPRPYMLSESSKMQDFEEFILKVKPGITGLWQVSGRNNLTFKERNELEVWYIKNWSLWADFVIMIKTIKVVLHKVGAK